MYTWASILDDELYAYYYCFNMFIIPLATSFSNVIDHLSMYVH